MKVNPRLCPNGTYTIEMNNSTIEKWWKFKFVRYNENNDPMSLFIKIAKHFTKNEKILFGHYRTDGSCLTEEERLQRGKEIEDYFQANGKYEPLTTTVRKKGKEKTYRDYLTASSLPVNDETYEILPKVFRYYLETVFFCPKIRWETFVQSYRDYLKHGAKDYVLNGFTDFLLTYSDSGNFSVSFNPIVHDPKTVLEEINAIIGTGDTGEGSSS